jgi:hypothetical protein
MQWLFTKSEARAAINLLNAKSFTVIYIRNIDLKILYQYNDMVMYPTNQKANEMAIEWINKTFREDKAAFHVEVVRK